MAAPKITRLSEAEVKRRLLIAAELPRAWWSTEKGLASPYEDLSSFHLAEKLASSVGLKLREISREPAIDLERHRKPDWIFDTARGGLSERSAQAFERVGRFLAEDLGRMIEGNALSQDLAVDPHRMFICLLDRPLPFPEGQDLESTLDGVSAVYGCRALGEASRPPVSHWATRNRMRRQSPDGIRALATAVNQLRKESESHSQELNVVSHVSWSQLVFDWRRGDRRRGR